MRRGVAQSICLAIIALAVPCGSAYAAFPGQNGKISFVRSDENYGNYRIHVANADASGDTEITSGSIGSTSDPEWSPDGRRLVYRGFSSRGRGGPAIFVTSADGSSTRELDLPWTRVDHPSWTPDGRIVYDFAVETNCNLFFCETSGGIRVMNADGRYDTEVSSLGMDPAWSPDGKKIAFVGAGPDGFDDIWVMNADGSGATDLTNNLSPEEQPTWSPDGKRIAFVRWIGSNFNTEIYVMDATGSGQENLTANSLPEGNPAWSPDGGWILFARAGALVKMRPTGLQQTFITATGHDGNPDWQPIANHPPDCSAVASSPASLWPPNHKLVTVTLGGASDPDGDAVTLSPSQARLRADPGGSYVISFEASDRRGGKCSGTATVRVQHSR